MEFVSISSILKSYARSFLYTESGENDATYFILSQLRGAIEELHQYLARKATELRKAEDLIRRSRKLRDAINPRQLALLNHALRDADARYTVASHQPSHNVTYETSPSDLTALTALGLLEQRKSGRAFVFAPQRCLARGLSALHIRAQMTRGQSDHRKSQTLRVGPGPNRVGADLNASNRLEVRAQHAHDRVLRVQQGRNEQQTKAKIS